MPSGAFERSGGEIGVDVHADRAGDVPERVSLARVPAGDPAHVGDHHAVEPTSR